MSVESASKFVYLVVSIVKLKEQMIKNPYWLKLPINITVKDYMNNMERGVIPWLKTILTNIPLPWLNSLIMWMMRTQFHLLDINAFAWIVRPSNNIYSPWKKKRTLFVQVLAYFSVFTSLWSYYHCLVFLYH